MQSQERLSRDVWNDSGVRLKAWHLCEPVQLPLSLRGKRISGERKKPSGKVFCVVRSCSTCHSVGGCGVPTDCSDALRLGSSARAGCILLRAHTYHRNLSWISFAQNKWQHFWRSCTNLMQMCLHRDCWHFYRPTHAKHKPHRPATQCLGISTLLTLNAITI